MDALGINVQSLLIYPSLFGVVYAIIAKMLLPALTKSIDDRAAVIAKVKTDHEALVEKTAAESAATALEKKTLADAGTKATSIVSAAEEEAAQIVKKANETAKSVIADAQQAIEKKKAQVDEQFEETVKARVGEILSLLPEIKKQYSASEIAKLIEKTNHDQA